MDFPTLVAFWLVCGVVGGVIGNTKDAGVSGFLLGALLGPLGVLAAFAVDGRPQCEKCRTRIDPKATICPQCRTERSASLEESDSASLNAEEEYVRKMRAKRAGKV